MNVKKAWETINIRRLTKSETIQHMSQNAVMIYVLSGETEIIANDYGMSFTTGEFFVIPNFSEVVVRFYPKESKIYLLSFDYFSEELENQMCLFRGDSKSKGESLTSTLSNALQQLLRLYYLKRTEASYWEVGALYFQIISKLEQKYQVYMPKEKGILTKESLSSYLSQHFRDNISIEVLAKQFFVSKQTMTRFFKSAFGKSLSKYLQEVRFKQLEKELSETDRAINTLVFELGFKNLNSFNRLFKNTYGMSPLAWRKSHRSDSKPVSTVNGAEQFSEFQEMMIEKTSQLRVSATNFSIRESKSRLCNVLNPELLLDSACFEKLCHLKNEGLIDSVRFPLSLNTLSEGLYMTILSALNTVELDCYLKLELSSIEKTNHYMQFLRNAVKELGLSMGKRLVLEVSSNLNQKDLMSDYYRFYRFAKDELKIKSCGLGGFSVYQNRDDLDTIFLTDDIKNRVDFLSFEALPLIKKRSHYSLRENIVHTTHVSRNITVIETFLTKVKSLISDVPLVLTSFNLTSDEIDAINDHLYLANHYLAFVDKVEPLVDVLGLGHYVFDHDDYFTSSEEFSGRSGFFTRSGLAKSIFYAESFRSSLPMQVLGGDSHISVSRDSCGKLTVLGYHYEPMSDYYSSDKTMDLYANQNYIFNMQAKSMQLEIDQVSNGTYKATFHILDLKNACGPLVLKNYTSLTHLDKPMIDFLGKQYGPRIYQKEIVVTDHLISEKLYVKPFEIVLVTYEKQIDTN